MFRLVLVLAASLAVLPSFASGALAQEPEATASSAQQQTPLELRADQVVDLLNGEIEPESIFSEGFLSAVPSPQFKAIAIQLTTQFGAALSVEALDPSLGNQAALEIRMERAIGKGSITIDPSNDNRVSGLLFRTFEPIDDNVEKIEADLKALIGDVTWWYGPLGGNSPAITSSNSDKQMPIGSAFKLYVLATLTREVGEGKRSWGDTVILGDTRSFPSGMMQDWPEGAPVTLHTLASMMISISDNTATDALIDELGREAILETLRDSGHSRPELNAPFLKTRELFLLKAGPEGRLRTYLGGTAQVRQQILDGMEGEEVSTGEVQAAFSGAPIALDVEWFASADDIAKLMTYIRERADPIALGIMAINPSMPDRLRSKWLYSGYKGGSEPGVLNLSWLLTDANGQDYALILNQRDDDVRFDPTALELIAQRLLSAER
jgi:Beta-lactamase enzyme family